MRGRPKKISIEEAVECFLHIVQYQLHAPYRAALLQSAKNREDAIGAILVDEIKWEEEKSKLEDTPHPPMSS